MLRTIIGLMQKLSVKNATEKTKNSTAVIGALDCEATSGIYF